MEVGFFWFRVLEQRRLAGGGTWGSGKDVIHAPRWMRRAVVRAICPVRSRIGVGTYPAGLPNAPNAPGQDGPAKGATFQKLKNERFEH